jgi:ferrous iron transport protein B
MQERVLGAIIMGGIAILGVVWAVIEGVPPLVNAKKQENILEDKLVEIVNEEEAREWEALHLLPQGMPADNCDDIIHRVAREKEKELDVVFVGNPNCGKTTLFNVACGAHERVGNYSGVTVDAKVGSFDFGGYHFNLVDLPGTYSLSAYTPEELYVRK